MDGDDSSDIEAVSNGNSVDDDDEFESAGSYLSDDASDRENAITIDDDDDPIQDEFDDLLPLFPAAPKPQTSVAVLKPEDASLNIAQLTLKYAFGLNAFRSHQEAVVNAALQGKDVLVLMPTGGGKSLCFQLPAVIARGVTLVITPLISLMYDQVQALLHAPNGGVPVTYLSSQRSLQDRVAVFKELEKPHPSIKLLYTTPEQLQSSEGLLSTLKLLYDRGTFARLVVDEAHCVSTWGHDFRPDYRKIAAFRKSFPDVPCTALTATATADVRADITRSLNMHGNRRGHAVFRANCFRPNLTLRVCAKPGDPAKADAVLVAYLNAHLAQHASGAVIVYCLSRRECGEVAEMLTDKGVRAVVYNAGLSTKKRREAQAAWQEGSVRVVVATIAFGMGIDKPNVRAVVHWTIASSVQGYFQEIGRGGRDGLPSECTLFYSAADASAVRFMAGRPGKGKTEQNRKRRQEQLDEMKAMCLMTDGCRHEALLQFFGDALPGHRCNTLCDLCCEAVSKHPILPLRPGLEPADPGAKKGGGGGGARGRGGKRKKGGKSGAGKGGGAGRGGGGVAKRGGRWGGRGGFRGRKKQ